LCATSASQRAFQSPRSPIASGARRGQSRRTSPARPGEKARAVNARYVGVCRRCGAYTQPRNGKGDTYAYCKACHPGAIERRWTPQRVLQAMLVWELRYGRLPSSYHWSRTHARWRGGKALRRLNEGSWPSASAVMAVSGSWSGARSAIGDAVRRAGLPSDAGESREVGDWAQSASLCPIPGNPPLYPRV
jgi:hypothetical protein